MRQQGVELVFDAPRQVVEVAQGPGAQEEIQTDREQTLLPALQTFAQSLGILERDLSLGIGDALAAQRCQPRRLEPGDLHTEGAHHRG